MFWQNAKSCMKTKATDACRSWRRDYDPVTEFIDKILKSDFDPAVFTAIDDRDMPEAPNWVEWCMGKDFLNKRPWAKQIEMGLALCGDACYDCSDPVWLKNIDKTASVDEILERVTLMQYGMCPKCKKTKLDFEREGKYLFPYQLTACLGQRTGKSTMVAGLVAPYMLHRFLKLPDPSRYFELHPTELHMTFTAVDYTQAEDTLWTPFKNYIEESPWFVEYNRVLQYYERKLSQEILYWKETFFLYRHKRLTGYAMTPNKRKMRGRTRMFYCIDEPGYFDAEAESRKVTLNCDEINAALERSMTTIREAAERKRKQGFINVPDGFAALVSSPSSINDKIMRELRVSETDPKKVGYHWATWEAHPTISRDSPTILSAFNENAAKANRDYGAIPGFGEYTFIGDEAAVKSCVGNHVMIATPTYHYHINDVGERTKYAKLNFRTADKLCPYVLAVDTGHSNNSFAIAVMHVVGNLIMVDVLVEVMPEKGARVDFKRMWDHIVLPCCDNLNCLVVAYDRWNSLQQVQELKDRKQFSEQYSLVRNDFINYRAQVTSGNVRFPKLEVPFDQIHKIKESVETLVQGKPVLHCILQHLTVREVGHKVDKGINMTDDLFRTCVLGFSYLTDPEWKSKFATAGRGIRGMGKTNGVIISRNARGQSAANTQQQASSIGVSKLRGSSSRTF
jgi:hypothetical protein